MNNLFELEPTISYCYVFFICIVGALFVRLFYAVWRTLESKEYKLNKNIYQFKPESNISWFKIFLKIFIGSGYLIEEVKETENGRKKEIIFPVAQDHFLGFFLGLLELFAYPFLLKSNLTTYVGAWLAFKTVNRWSYTPNINRGFFTRYLIANALILMLSFYFAKFLFF